MVTDLYRGSCNVYKRMEIIPLDIKTACTQSYIKWLITVRVINIPCRYKISIQISQKLSLVFGRCSSNLLSFWALQILSLYNLCASAITEKKVSLTVIGWIWRPVKGHTILMKF